MHLKNNIEHVEQRLAEACRRSGRQREDVQVIAVTKYSAIEKTRQIIEHGFGHIGENRWQDARSKWEQLGPLATWHFIGHLQTNKVKDVIGKFAYIHSLDRPSLAKELERRASSLQLTINCFIQLNISGEQSKHGLAPDQLLPFVESIRDYTHLNIVGLMTMAPYEEDPEMTRPVFRALREWRDRLNESHLLPYEVPHLSMGMSNDFEVAVEEGATWVRLGSILTKGE